MLHWHWIKQRLTQTPVYLKPWILQLTAAISPITSWKPLWVKIMHSHHMITMYKVCFNHACFLCWLLTAWNISIIKVNNCSVKLQNSPSNNWLCFSTKQLLKINLRFPSVIMYSVLSLTHVLFESSISQSKCYDGLECAVKTESLFSYSGTWPVVGLRQWGFTSLTPEM